MQYKSTTLKSVTRVLLVVNTQKDEAADLSEEIVRFLRLRDVDCVVFPAMSRELTEQDSTCELAVSLGGDGTVLYTARLLAGLGIPILPLNLGNFGFITEVAKDEWKESIEKTLCGELTVGERVMLEVTVRRVGGVVFSSRALNDLVFTSSGTSRLIRLRVRLGGTDVGGYRADGLIIAAPTGSTAYSAAAGGPILHPEMDAMILTPICPFTLSNRPLVVPARETIEVVLEPAQRTMVMITVDGQESFDLEEHDVVQVGSFPCRIPIVHSDRRNFYSVLMQKLNWSGGPDA